MQSVKIYPAELGVSGWLETSTYKNHQFNHEDEILDEYDYVVVGAGYGGLGAATRLKLFLRRSASDRMILVKTLDS